MYSYDRRNQPRAKTALLQEGPVGRVLGKVWNTLHDIEYDLEQTVRDYDDAAHFMDGPAEREAKEMVRKIQACVKELEHISKNTFSDLIEDEASFVKKFGDPAEYADSMRRKTFPR